MRKILPVLLLILCASSALGKSIVSDSQLKELAAQRTWLKLLYFDPDSQQSDVLSDDYFLSEQGKISPEAELAATIAAYDQPFPDDPNTHPVCRFPARYMWLSQQIELENYQTIHPKCEALWRSVEKTPIDSISLMSVAGYLGNPASSFGHSFLKLNKHSVIANSNLFDLAISYGADVPDNENIFFYIYRGLFGKYTAGFTDKYFYHQDLVYSKNELRDIWEYELDLTKEKVFFFQLHVWEIMGKKFKYLFLNKNCGYEVTRMVEIVLEDDLVTSASVWFAPIETFHKLVEIDQTKGVIRKITYHPSEQQKVYKQYQDLNRAEKHVVSMLVHSGMLVDQTDYRQLNDDEKIHTLNFIITYYDYLRVKDGNSDRYDKLKQKALIQRFGLPVKRERVFQFDNISDPHDNDKPSVLFGGFNTTGRQGNYLSIGYTPYALRSLGQNNLNGDELTVLESEVGFTENSPFLKKIDVIRIRRYNRYHIPLGSDSGLSWRLDLSYENVDIARNQFDAVLDGGVGKSWVLTPQIMLTGLLTASLHSRGSPVMVTPEISARVDMKRAKLLVRLQKEFDIFTHQSRFQTQINSNIKIKKDIDLFVDYYHSDSYQLSAGLRYYFY